MTIGFVLLLLLLGGIAVFLVQRAPFIDATWKSYISYAILFIVVIVLVGGLLGGWGQLANIHVGR